MTAAADIAAALRAARQEAGLSQRQLAEASGRAQQNICSYELGSKSPNLTTLLSLADALERDVVLAPRVARAESAAGWVVLVSRYGTTHVEGGTVYPSREAAEGRMRVAAPAYSGDDTDLCVAPLSMPAVASASLHVLYKVWEDRFQ